MFKFLKKSKKSKKSTLASLILIIALFALFLSLFLVVIKMQDNNKKTIEDIVKKQKIEPDSNFSSNDSSRPQLSPALLADKIKNNENTKITIEIYEDFECPFCMQYTNTIAKILEEYGNDINLVFKHFPLTAIHKQAQKAAEAYECAKDQNKEWQMHDEIFKLSFANNLSTRTIKLIAGEIGLDQELFDECLGSDKYKEKVLQDIVEGKTKGVTRTPTTFINNDMIIGAISYESLKDDIEYLLR